LRKIETRKVVLKFEPFEQRGYKLRVLDNPELRKNLAVKSKKLLEK